MEIPGTYERCCSVYYAVVRGDEKCPICESHAKYERLDAACVEYRAALERIRARVVLVSPYYEMVSSALDLNTAGSDTLARLKAAEERIPAIHDAWNKQNSIAGRMLWSIAKEREEALRRANLAEKQLENLESWQFAGQRFDLLNPEAEVGKRLIEPLAEQNRDMLALTEALREIYTIAQSMPRPHIASIAFSALSRPNVARLLK